MRFTQTFGVKTPGKCQFGSWKTRWVGNIKKVFFVEMDCVGGM